MDVYDLAIVGGDPAGASAATFAARAGLTTLVIDADKGMTRRALLNNHLGFPEGITGPELVDAGRSQAERAGATWVDGKVESLTTGDEGIVLATDWEAAYTAAEVLLTIGVLGARHGDEGTDAHGDASDAAGHLLWFARSRKLDRAVVRWGA